MAKDFLGISVHVDIDELVNGRIVMFFYLVYQASKNRSIYLEIWGIVSNFALKMRSSTPDFQSKCGVVLPIFKVFCNDDTAII